MLITISINQKLGILEESIRDIGIMKKTNGIRDINTSGIFRTQLVLAMEEVDGHSRNASNIKEKGEVPDTYYYFLLENMFVSHNDKIFSMSRVTKEDVK